MEVTAKMVATRMLRNTIVIYTVIYIATVFITWGFYNPFQCIIDIPTYGEGTRFCILFYGMIYVVTNAIGSYNTLKE